MKRFCRVFAIGLGSLLIALAFGRPSQTAGQEKRESIFNRKIHIENKLSLEIPKAPRLCDSLGLKKMRINVGNCELYVEEEGKGVPVILINGGPGGTHHYFHPWFSRASSYARVIYYDQRGCGLSDYQPGKDGYSVDQAISDLDAIRKSLGIDKWVVLGYSYGGFLAQFYATRCPENLAGLILLGASPGTSVKMKPSRQYDFMSEEEKTRLKQIGMELGKLTLENKWPPEKFMALLVYNNHLNGDWKRQHFYKPSPEKLAQGALYEWNFDMKNDFRGGISASEDRIDLAGAFDSCPIPTLILEGQWDLTWNTDKPEILAKNHPGSKLIMFENAGHGVYDENPDKFFAAVKEFLTNLPNIAPQEIASYKASLTEWSKKQKAASVDLTTPFGWGRASMEKLAKAYKREWCETLENAISFLKTGFALYEAKNYDEALYIFERMQKSAEKSRNTEHEALALIWQAHMLDLLGKRAEAVALYKRVAEMNIKSAWKHSQYGLEYEVSTYAKERMTKPFVRIENFQKF